MRRGPFRSATLRRLQSRRIPPWWADAKFGIFVHWGPYSVPGFAPPDVDPHEMLTLRVGGSDPLANNPYAEWYENSLRFSDSPTSRHHAQNHAARSYSSFADEFRAGIECWDPEVWADQFARSGARYVVLVTKHHDGFCLWPSSVPNPNRSGWHSERDVVGELAEAVRARGLHFGAYYSGGLDWTFDDRPIGGPADLFAAVPDSSAYSDYAEAQVRELVERYRPSVLWNDIAWPFGGERLWRLLGDYIDAVPDGVVNDRFHPRQPVWGLLRTTVGRAVFDEVARRVVSSGAAPPRPPHFDHLTPEYTSSDGVASVPWETCRGVDRSFAYNRMSRPEHFLSRDDLLGSLADIVSKGGNLLLNVGPRGEDATIPVEQLLRLEWAGEWLAAAGPAIRGSRPWVVSEGVSPEGHRLRYTASGDDVHILVLDGPPGRLTLCDVEPSPTGAISSPAGPLSWRRGPDGTITVDLDGEETAEPWPLAITVHAGRAH